MINLLSNAAKYSFEGAEVSIQAEMTRSGLWTVRVHNQGPGFSPEERQQLFRRFSRLKRKELNIQRGTGVGLYNSWRIIKQHHGKMNARSELGQWAEFSFSIPAGRVDRPDHG